MRKPATWLRVATPETRRVARKPGPNILGPRPAVEPGLRRAASRKLPGQGGTALVHRQTFQNRGGAGQRCCSGGGIPAAVNDLSERSRSQWASKVCECCRRPRHRFGCPRSVPKEAGKKNEAGPRYGGRQQAVWWSAKWRSQLSDLLGSRSWHANCATFRPRSWLFPVGANYSVNYSANCEFDVGVLPVGFEHLAEKPTAKPTARANCEFDVQP